ncbi:hypothetical protein Tco_0995205, partial [Tanacetum coccineum]
VQQVQGRQGQSYVGTGNKGNATSSDGNNAGGQARVVKCYNCQGIAVLAQAQELGHVLDEEQLAFFADPGIPDGQAAQTTIPNNVAFQTEDLDAYDSDCDDVSTTKAVMMANLSNYGSDVLSEVHHSEPYHNDMNNQSVHAIQDFEQTPVVDFLENEITSDNNIIIMIDSQMDDMIKENLALKQQIDSLEQNLSNQIKEKEYLLQTFTVFKNESKKKESKYMDKEIDLEKNIKELDNIIYKVGQSAQRVHIQHAVIPVINEEETLILEEVSRSKMLAKQNDPISKEKKINTTPINYVELNQLSEDFGKRFVPQQELSAEQAFWLQTSNPNTKKSDISPVRIEAPSELPKVSLVNTSLKKLKFHLSKFDTVVKKQITPDAITEGEWGFEHTKAVFLNEIIPFLKTLKDIFNVFDKDLLNEVTEVQTVFNQMEAAVQQCSVDKQCFEIHKKELFLDNDRLLHQITSRDIILTVMNSTTVYGDSVNLEMQSRESCDKCFDLDAELLKKQNAYNELLKSYSQLEKH